jgi:hypothetical protein
MEYCAKGTGYGGLGLVKENLESNLNLFHEKRNNANI